MISIEFTQTRAQASREAQAIVAATWLWPHKTVVQWDTDIVQLAQLKTDEVNKRTAWRHAATVWDGDLEEIQRITRDVRREGLFKFRNDPLKRQPFENLSTDAQSRADIYAQGNAARAAWEQADPAWTYAQDVTVGSLGSLLANSFTHQQTNTRKETAWRNAAAALMTKAGALDVDNMAWYAAATRRFAAGTTEGDMIHSTVPTTTRPEAAVGQAVISNLMVSGSDIHFDAAAEHATRYTYLHQAPGSSVFLVAVADTPSSAFTLHGQAPGAHKFKVIGSNASSQGEESAAVEATVAQAAVA